MRPLPIGDVIAAARALIARDETGWASGVGDLFDQADAADRFRRATGRPHPAWGDGSLMSVASAGEQLPEPYLTDLRFLRALRCVLDAAISRENAFLTAGDRLYSRGERPLGVVSNGRDTSENGVD